jgi:hypothetical protein
MQIDASTLIDVVVTGYNWYLYGCWAFAGTLPLVLCDVCFNEINVHLFNKKLKKMIVLNSNMFHVFDFHTFLHTLKRKLFNLTKEFPPITFLDYC